MEKTNKNLGCNERILKQRATKRRFGKKRKCFDGNKNVLGVDFTLTSTENNTDVEDGENIPSGIGLAVDLPASSSGSNEASSSLPNPSQASSSGSGKYRKYKKLVNRSKIKLMNSALHDDKQFKSKTPSQRRKLELLKDKNRIPAVGYKLVDICLLEKMLEKCCICKYCKKSQGKNKN